MNISLLIDIVFNRSYYYRLGLKPRLHIQISFKVRLSDLFEVMNPTVTMSIFVVSCYFLLHRTMKILI